MKLIYEELALLFPSGYTVRLDNLPAEGNVVVLTENLRLAYTEELNPEEVEMVTNSDIQVYVRYKDEEADNEKIINDLILFFNTIYKKTGQYIGNSWVWAVEPISGPLYLGRDGENALFSMNMRVRYKYTI